MAETLRTSEPRMSGAPAAASHPARIPVIPLGLSLGCFFAITFVLCVGFDLLFPAHAMFQTWQKLLPGFRWISWGSFLVGLVESYGYGWYLTLIWVPLYNVLAARGKGQAL